MKINFSKMMLVMIGITLEASGVEVHYDGALRVGYQYHDSGSAQGSDMAMGGMLHAQSLSKGGISFGMRVETSNVLMHKNDAFGLPFFDSEAGSYALLSEAYMRGEFETTTFIFGRQQLDRPFLDSDDVGMVANRFEAYTFIYHDKDALRLFYSYVRTMAGVDAPKA